MMSELMRFEARLASLEQQNLRLWATMITIVLAIAGIFLMGQSAPASKSIEADRFVLRGGDGKVRAQLSVINGEAGLRLYDAGENLRAGLAMVNGEPGLFYWDSGQKQRAAFAVLRGEPGLFFYDLAQNERMWLSVRNGIPGLVLRDEQGANRIRLGLTGDDPGFVLYDPRGTVRKNRGGKRFGLSLTGGNGKTVAQLDATDEGPGLALYDRGGKLRLLLDSAEDEPVFLVTDTRGNVRGTLAMTGQGASLTFFDANGKTVSSTH